MLVSASETHCFAIGTIKQTGKSKLSYLFAFMIP